MPRPEEVGGFTPEPREEEAAYEHRRETIRRDEASEYYQFMRDVVRTQLAYRERERCEQGLPPAAPSPWDDEIQPRPTGRSGVTLDPADDDGGFTAWYTGRGPNPFRPRHEPHPARVTIVLLRREGHQS